MCNLSRQARTRAQEHARNKVSDLVDSERMTGTARDETACGPSKESTYIGGPDPRPLAAGGLAGGLAGSCMRADAMHAGERQPLHGRW